MAVFDAFGNYLHDLVTPQLPPGAAIEADDRGVIVLSGLQLFLYDEHDRPTGRTSIDSLGSLPPPPVRDISLSGGLLYVLTDGAVTAFPDPRPRADGLQK